MSVGCCVLGRAEVPQPRGLTSFQSEVQHPIPNTQHLSTGAGVQVTTTHRVNYSEVDQMGVVYHANYLVWLDVARCELLRQAGMSYKELEAKGFFLVVSEARLRYKRAVRYDDEVRVKCWVREVGSRKVGFGYAIEQVESGELLATAVIELLSLSHTFQPTRLPPEVSQMLPVTADPIRVD